MSEQPKHTPGPWHFVQENAGLMSDHGYGLLHGSPGAGGWEENLFVSVGCSSRAEGALGVGVPEANARLIAAAPDMLAALRDCRAGLVYIRASHGELYGVGFDRAIHAADEAIAKVEGRI